eukprot:8521617-Alexandrium_andersonii.AAC.1
MEPFLFCPPCLKKTQWISWASHVAPLALRDARTVASCVGARSTTGVPNGWAGHECPTRTRT